MDPREGLKNADKKIEKLKTTIAEIEPKLLELIKVNIGKKKQDPKIDIGRRKLQREKVKLQELDKVRDDFKKDIAEAKAKEADTKLKESATTIVKGLKGFQAKVKAVNDLKEQFERAVVSLQVPLARLSEVILQCHEAKKLSYLDTEGIHNNMINLWLNTSDPRLIDDKNLETQTGINQFSNAMEGKGSYHKAKAPVRYTPTETQQTEAETIRQEIEEKRWRDGGPTVPQFHQ